MKEYFWLVQTYYMLSFMYRLTSATDIVHNSCWFCWTTCLLRSLQILLVRVNDRKFIIRVVSFRDSNPIKYDRLVHALLQIIWMIFIFKINQPDLDNKSISVNLCYLILVGLVKQNCNCKTVLRLKHISISNIELAGMTS